VSPCSEQSFSSLETLVLNHVSAVSGCVCVLLGWDEQRRHFVEALRSLRTPTMVLVLIHAEQDDLDPGPMADQPEHFHVLRLNRIQEDLEKLR
jgi:hypothetical protein